METAVVQGGLKPTCFRRKKEYQSIQMSFDVEALLMKLVRPRRKIEPWRYEDRTNEALYDFVVGFFEESLASLKTQGSQEEKKDVLEWIFEPATVHLIHETLVIAVPTDKLAWSYRWCCRLFGYNAEELQQQLLEEMTGLECYPHHQDLFDHYRDTFRI